MDGLACYGSNASANPGGEHGSNGGTSDLGGICTETGPYSEGAFSVSAADAPGPLRTEDRRESNELRPHAQRRFTSECKHKRVLGLRGLIRAPGPANLLRVAHDKAGTGSLFWALFLASSADYTTVTVFLRTPIHKAAAALDGGTYFYFYF